MLYFAFTLNSSHHDSLPPSLRRSSSGEPLTSSASSPYSSPAAVGELLGPTAPGALRAGEAPPCLMSAPLSVHRGPQCATGPWRRGPGPWVLPLRNNYNSIKSHEFNQEALELVVN
jgi:hypothetical protein